MVVAVLGGHGIVSWGINGTCDDNGDSQGVVSCNFGDWYMVNDRVKAPGFDTGV